MTVISATVLKAQEQTFIQAFDSVFMNVSKTDATTKLQTLYKASVGGMLPSFMAMGASFKTFFSEHIAFQTELLYKVTLVGSIDKKRISFGGVYPAIEFNTNVMYQKKIKNNKKFELFWFIGGGVSLGCDLFGPNGKFGTNMIIGLEYIFLNKPLAFQIDVRPGYGMLFNSDKRLNNGFYPNINPWSHFDWLIGFTLRYTFKNK